MEITLKKEENYLIWQAKCAPVEKGSTTMMAPVDSWLDGMLVLRYPTKELPLSRTFPLLFSIFTFKILQGYLIDIIGLYHKCTLTKEELSYPDFVSVLLYRSTLGVFEFFGLSDMGSVGVFLRGLNPWDVNPG